MLVSYPIDDVKVLGRDLHPDRQSDSVNIKWMLRDGPSWLQQGLRRMKSFVELNERLRRPMYSRPHGDEGHPDALAILWSEALGELLALQKYFRFSICGRC